MKFEGWGGDQDTIKTLETPYLHDSNDWPSALADGFPRASRTSLPKESHFHFMGWPIEMIKGCSLLIFNGILNGVDSRGSSVFYLKVKI